MCAAPKGNKFALGLTTSGRPRVYPNPADLDKRVVKYFKECEKEGTKFTTTGLALFLGYSRRQTLYDVAKQGDEFAHIIERALLRIEQMYEERLDNQSVAGSIFALSNMGWKNRQAMEISDPNGNALPAPVQQINVGIDYSKLPTAALDAILQARTNELPPEDVESSEA